MPYLPWSPSVAGGGMEHCGPWAYGSHMSIQVNVNANGCNIVGDAANEPSIAVDPTNPNNVVIGWRQFDTIASDFRQAGYAYSHDAGQTWTFPGVLAPGTFHSDPVLQANSAGDFYYLGVNEQLTSDIFRSMDAGMTWEGPIAAFGGDKHWMAVDNTDGVGNGNIYTAWSRSFGCCGANIFSRSINGGTTFLTPVTIPSLPFYGTLAVGVDGAVYVAGDSDTGIIVSKSANAQDPAAVPTFGAAVHVDLNGLTVGGAPNPGGLLGQTWIATDSSGGQSHENVYVLQSVRPNCCLQDPMDVMIARSTDGGVTWSAPVRVNDDAQQANSWQWFGTLSVAPNGRIDVVWYDTRAMLNSHFSQLFYSYSVDAGTTWSANIAVSPVFDTYVGWAQNQSKIGDYIHAVSDTLGVRVAYAATFNGEQDVYSIRIMSDDCNGNGVPDAEDLASGTSNDCNNDEIPDECNIDCNHNGFADACDLQNGTSEDCDADQTPDECEADFDFDGITNDCDADIDNDGLSNAADACDFTPVGAAIRMDGSTIGDRNNDCDVDLMDYSILDNCIMGGGPNDPVSNICLTAFDADSDADIDLRDVANFQIAFSGS